MHAYGKRLEELEYNVRQLAERNLTIRAITNAIGYEAREIYNGREPPVKDLIMDKLGDAYNTDVTFLFERTSSIN